MESGTASLVTAKIMLAQSSGFNFANQSQPMGWDCSLLRQKLMTCVSERSSSYIFTLKNFRAPDGNRTQMEMEIEPDWNQTEMDIEPYWKWKSNQINWYSSTIFHLHTLRWLDSLKMVIFYVFLQARWIVLQYFINIDAIKGKAPPTFWLAWRLQISKWRILRSAMNLI